MKNYMMRKNLLNQSLKGDVGEIVNIPSMPPLEGDEEVKEEKGF